MWSMCIYEPLRLQYVSVYFLHIGHSFMYLQYDYQNQEINIDKILCRPYSNFPKIFQIGKRSSERFNSGSHVAFGSHVSLVLFNLE